MLLSDLIQKLQEFEAHQDIGPSARISLVVDDADGPGTWELLKVETNKYSCDGPTYVELVAGQVLY